MAIALGLCRIQTPAPRVPNMKPIENMWIEVKKLQEIWSVLSPRNSDDPSGLWEINVCKKKTIADPGTRNNIFGLQRELVSCLNLLRYKWIK